jgi:hypothetical protein
VRILGKEESLKMSKARRDNLPLKAIRVESDRCRYARLSAHTNTYACASLYYTASAARFILTREARLFLRASQPVVGAIRVTGFQ